MAYEDVVKIPAQTIIPPNQNVSVTTTPNPIVPTFTGASIIAPVNQAWNNPDFSNGLLSRNITGAAGINDFTIINPYRHYSLPSMVINPMSLLQLSTVTFNIYSSQYRTW